MAYDPNKNYADAISAAIASGASPEAVAQLNAERNEKIAANAEHYAAKGISGGDQYGTAATNYVGTAQAAQQTPAQAVQQSPAASGTQPLAHADTSNIRSYLEQSLDLAVEQASGQIDRAVTQGVNELRRVQEDANEQYQNQQNQVSLDERRALDNRALYNAAQGVGGIGAEQWSAIQNAAAQNRVTINNARTKTATEIGRQMAELRSNGEFEKAKAYLQATQEYLAKITQLEQWEQEFNVAVDQFNAQMQLAEREYQLKLRELEISVSQWERQFAEGKRQFNVTSGLQQQQLAEGKRQFDATYGLQQEQFAEGKRQFNVTSGLQQQQYADTQAAQKKQDALSKVEAMLNVGMMPDEETLKAAGLSKKYAQLYISAWQAARDLATEQAAVELEGKKATTLKTLAEAAQKSGAEASGDLDALAKAFVASGSASPKTWLASNYKAYGFTSKPDAEEFADAVDEVEKELSKPAVKDARVGFSPDEGIITFDGKSFKTLEEFVKYVNAHAFTESEWETLMRGISRWPELSVALGEEG